MTTDRRPLLLTRPREQSTAFARALEAAAPGRFEPVVAPILRIAPLEVEIDLADAQGLLFTSANGVEVFAALCADRGLPAYCVGDMTARAARDAGFAARSAGGDVESLAALAAAAARGRPGRLLHVRGRHAAGDLVGRLDAAGVETRPLEIYDQVPAALPPEVGDRLAARDIAVLAAFSPRSAALFAKAARAANWNLAGATLVALSENANAAHDAPEPGRRVVAAAPTRAAMLAALAAL